VTKVQAGGDVNEKERSGQQMKEEKKRKTNQVAVASCFAFMSRRAQQVRIREKRGDSPPLVFASERGVPCTC
jgi:hypothetical protein